MGGFTTTYGGTTSYTTTAKASLYKEVVPFYCNGDVLVLFPLKRSTERNKMGIMLGGWTYEYEQSIKINNKWNKKGTDYVELNFSRDGFNFQRKETIYSISQEPIYKLEFYEGSYYNTAWTYVLTVNEKDSEGNETGKIDIRGYAYTIYGKDYMSTSQFSSTYYKIKN